MTSAPTQGRIQKRRLGPTTAFRVARNTSGPFTSGMAEAYWVA
jgi:hypothetical protein